MRTMLLVVAVLVGGCSARPCDNCITGCCDSQGSCRPGTSDGWCGANGGDCQTCSAATCSPTGFCVSRTGGGGGLAGGGGGATGGGGGSGEPTVSVLLRYNRAACCSAAACACTDCHQMGCQVTKTITQSRFDQLRSTDWAACPIAPRSPEGYDVNCSNNCTQAQTTCVVNNVTMPDVSVTCTQVPSTSLSACDWNP